jgi:hypothetical protein
MEQKSLPLNLQNLVRTNSCFKALSFGKVCYIATKTGEEGIIFRIGYKSPQNADSNLSSSIWAHIFSLQSLKVTILGLVKW